jgi:hypothetical protein
MAENGSLGLGGEWLPADAWFIYVGKETGMSVRRLRRRWAKSLCSKHVSWLCCLYPGRPKCAIFLRANFIFFTSDADAFLSFFTRLMKIYG